MTDHRLRVARTLGHLALGLVGTIVLGPPLYVYFHVERALRRRRAARRAT